MLPPLLVQLLLVRHYPDDVSDYKIAATRFQTCMAFLEQLGKIYWHAGFYYDLLEVAGTSSQSNSLMSDTARKARGGQTPLPQIDGGVKIQGSQHAQSAVGSTSDGISPETGPAPYQPTYPHFPTNATLNTITQIAAGGIQADNAKGMGEMSLGDDGQLFEDWLNDRWMEEHELFRTMFPSA